MLENKTREHLIEARRGKRQIENVGLLEHHIAETRTRDAVFCRHQRIGRYVDRSDAG